MSELESLISLVKIHPYLYDSTHRDYKDNAQKRNVWDDIAKQLGLETGDLAKHKWRTLRDTYVKYLRSNNRTITGLNRKKWRWANKMYFLKPHIIKHSVTTTQPLSNDVSETESEFKEEVGIVCKEELMLNNDDDDDNCTFPNSSKIDDETPIPYTVMDYFNNKPVDKKNADAVDLLFLSYAQTLKTFSERRQAEIKMQISLIMNKAELAHIEERERNFGNSTQH